jgi:hypothetical protein
VNEKLSPWSAWYDATKDAVWLETNKPVPNDQVPDSRKN